MVLSIISAALLVILALMIASVKMPKGNRIAIISKVAVLAMVIIPLINTIIKAI